MCSTCDHTKYEKYEETKGNIVITRMRNIHAMLDISCDISGKDYKIGNFTIYRCPTCGRQLF